MIEIDMFLRLVAILGLLIQPLTVVVGLNGAPCDQRDTIAAVAIEMQDCGCCEMATSCQPDQPMACGCMESNEPVAPPPTAPRNNTSKTIALPALLTAAITVDVPTASSVTVFGRSTLSYRSHTHKQATLCVWRT